MIKKDKLVEQLAKNGYEVQNETKSKVVVKLPLFSNLYIKLNEDSYKIEPRFGLIKRNTAMYLEIIVGLVLTTMIIFRTTISSNLKLGIIYLLVLAVILDIYRWSVTEKAISKIKKRICYKR